MRGMPFHVQGQGVLDVVDHGAKGPAAPARGEVFCLPTEFSNSVSNCGKRKREVVEPRSVLDQRRSSSPRTSTSTLSSSLGGGAVSSDTAGVAALSDSNDPSSSSAHRHNKWPPSSGSTPSSAPAPHADIDAKKEVDWEAELQPFPAGLDVGILGGDTCDVIAGVDDWEAMLGDTVVAAAVASSPSHEQTFIRWIMDDMDDLSNLCNIKQQQAQQLGLPQPTVTTATDHLDVSSAALAFSLLDPVSFGFGTISTAAAAPATNNSPQSSAFLPTANTSRGSLPVQQFRSVKVPSICKARTFSAQTVNSLPQPPELIFLDTGAVDEKPLLPDVLGHGGLLLNRSQHQTNPTFFLPITQPEHGILQSSPPKRHNAPTLGGSGDPSDVLFRRGQPPDPQQLQHLDHQQQPHGVPYLLQLRPMKPKSGGDEAAAAQQQQQQALVDQLFKAAELVEAGNSVSARRILARLNQQLPHPIGKPVTRSAFIFKEALQNVLNSSSNTTHRNPLPASAASPLDVMLKLTAYKAFSEVSPVIQFTNFTCVQALLEELGPAEHIHIVDFDIGIGGQWSSFMQELAQQRCTTTTSTAAVPPFLKITSFVSPSSHHPVELHLTRENLSHFASDLNIPFEFNVFPLDSFDPATILAMSGGADEAIAVILPVGSAFAPSIPTILRLVKQLSPKIVISVDQGCDRSDLQFSHHFLKALQTSIVLLDSIDAAGAIQDVANKIERFLLQPRIENSLISRHRAGKKILPWRSLLASAGFMPVQFSNFTESQAEYLLKRVQVRGFHVEKRQASLFLYWQRGELASVSAWRC